MADQITKVVITAEDKTAAAFTSVMGSLKTLGGALGAAFSVDTLLSFGAAIVEQGKKAEQANNRLTAVLRATGEAAGFTKKQLVEMADALSRSTQFDDESIKGAQAELLKFRNIHGPVFTEALKLSADVAAFFGEDIPAAAAKLGKSLEDPETAFGLLKRAGIVLSDQQKDLIKKFEEMGHTAEAQQIILDRLKGAFGGTAEEMNQGITKATNDLTKEWDELLKSLSQTPSVNGGLIQTSGVVTTLLRQVRELIDESNRANLNKLGISIPKSTRLSNSEFGKPIGRDGFQQSDAHVLSIEESEAVEYARQKKRAELMKKLDKENSKRAQDRLEEEMKTRGQMGELATKAEEEEDKRELERQLKIEDSVRSKIESLSDGFRTEKEIADAHYQEMSQVLEDARLRDIIGEQEYKLLSEQLEIEHQAKLGDITAQGVLKRKQFEQMNARQQTQFVLGEILNMTQGVAAHNKKMFEINKIAGIATATINTAIGVTQALRAYPPPISFVMAALQLAAGVAQIQQIQSTQYGTATSAPSIAGGNAVPVMDADRGSGIPSLYDPKIRALDWRVIHLNLPNDSGIVSTDWLRDIFIPGLNDALGDGVKLRL